MSNTTKGQSRPKDGDIKNNFRHRQYLIAHLMGKGRDHRKGS